MKNYLFVLLFILLTIPITISHAYEKISYDDFRKAGGNSYVKLDSGWTNYELSGDLSSDKAVVLIHGGTIPHCIWEAQMESLRRAGFKVLRYDQYGRGYSDRPRKTYSRDLFMNQLKGLLDSLNIMEPVTLIGPSFGGAISVNFAAHYPQRVKSLILVSPALNLLNSDSPLAGKIKILRTPLIGELLYKVSIRKKLIERGRALVPGGYGSPCDSTFTKQFRCKGTQRSFFSMFRSDAYGDYRELSRTASKNISNILLIRGNEDKDITENMVQEIKADIPNAPFVEIEKSGHNPGTDAAAVFNKLIVDFITNN
jgi:pimeloyl-ACP methyl ester carboxylesterase